MAACADAGRWQVSDTEKRDEAVRWIRKLLRRHGVETIAWGDGSFGPVNVPKKWAGIIGDMATAIQLLAQGEGLPEFEPERKESER
jgi:hypothetical protein